MKEQITNLVKINFLTFFVRFSVTYILQFNIISIHYEISKIIQK